VLDRSKDLRGSLKIEKLYDSFGDKIYHYLTVKLGSPNDAEDVLQEIFYRLVRYSFRLRLVRNPGAFVFKIARNEAYRYLKNKTRKQGGCQKNFELHEVIRSTISGPKAEAEDMVARALSRLPDDQREIIILKVFEGLTFKEIASVCGLSINTASSRYRYGLEKLRSLMEERDEKPE